MRTAGQNWKQLRCWRFYALDSWRGIAAVMVALFHMPIAWSLYDVGIVRHAWLFVDFFFVLSGFVIAFTYEYNCR